MEAASSQCLSELKHGQTAPFQASKKKMYSKVCCQSRHAPAVCFRTPKKGANSQLEDSLSMPPPPDEKAACVGKAFPKYDLASVLPSWFSLSRGHPKLTHAMQLRNDAGLISFGS